MTDTIETVEVVEATGTEIEPYNEPVGLPAPADPRARIESLRVVADELAQVIATQHLYYESGGKKIVTYEGLALLGSMFSLTPYTVWTRPIEGGFEARVELRTIRVSRSRRPRRSARGRSATGAARQTTRSGR
jgi:hypothetical protein